MNSTIHIQLNTSPDQVARLTALQAAFAEVCNALGPVVQQTRCWNRVTLHHLTYRTLRDRFPQLGSQMVCNAIYSVSRTSRLLFQSPASPWSIAKLGDRPLPLLRFLANAPVYFDRHTLSLKSGRLSMYTLDGRMHFQIQLKAEDEARFHNEKLREVVLQKMPAGHFQLSFFLSSEDDAALPTDSGEATAELPEYVLVKEADGILDAPLPIMTAAPAAIPTL